MSVVRLIGAIVIGAVAVTTWAYGPKSAGNGNNFALAIPATLVVLGGYLFIVRNLISRFRLDWNVTAEFNYVCFGAALTALILVLATFDGS